MQMFYLEAEYSQECHQQLDWVFGLAPVSDEMKANLFLSCQGWNLIIGLMLNNYS